MGKKKWAHTDKIKDKNQRIKEEKKIKTKNIQTRYSLMRTKRLGSAQKKIIKALNALV